MDYIGFALPIQPGKSGTARAFLTEREGPRKGQYATSERKIGISKEHWFYHQTPNGDLIVAYCGLLG